MPSISKRVGRHGAVTYLAQARVLGGGSMSKTFEDRATAKAWATKQEAEFKHQRQRGAPVRLDVGQLTIEKLARDYLDDDVTKAQRSLSETQRLIGWWVNKYGSRKVLDISSVMLREARKKLQDEGRGPATTNRHLSAMRACWNWGVQAEYIPETRSWPKKLMLKEPGGRVRFLSDAELAAVLKVTDEEPVTQATIMVSVGTGIRLGEMLRLKWDDIDLTGKHSPTGTPRLSVWVTKTDKPRAVFLPDAVVEALKKLRTLPVVSPVHVFLDSKGKAITKGTLDKRWRKVRANAKVKDFHWHDLRHTYASHLLQQGATLGQIGAQLGHSSPSMTMRYSHLVQGAPVTGHEVLNNKLARK